MRDLLLSCFRTFMHCSLNSDDVNQCMKADCDVQTLQCKYIDKLEKQSISLSFILKAGVLHPPALEALSLKLVLPAVLRAPSGGLSLPCD